jgi:hypothetical protein
VYAGREMMMMVLWGGGAVSQGKGRPCLEWLPGRAVAASKAAGNQSMQQACRCHSSRCSSDSTQGCAHDASAPAGTAWNVDLFSDVVHGVWCFLSLHCRTPQLATFLRFSCAVS